MKEDYDKAFDLEVRILVHIAIVCLPFNLKSKGNMLNISKIEATYRDPNLSKYSGTKAAVDNFTRCWIQKLKKTE